VAGVGGMAGNDGGMMLPRPAGDTCETAEPLPMNATLTFADGGFTDDYGQNLSCAGNAAADRAFVVQVPAGQQLTVVVTGQAPGHPYISFAQSAADCGTARCLTSVNSFAVRDVANLPVSLSWTNRSTTIQSVYVVVDIARGPSFSISHRIAAPPADDTCQGAITVMPGMTRNGDTTAGYSNEYAGTNAASCAGPARGGDRVYRVPVSSMQAVQVVATGIDGGLAPLLNVFRGPDAGVCDDPVRNCIAQGPRVLTRSEATYFNGSVATEDLYVVASQLDPAQPYNLSVATMPPLTDDTCSSAQTMLPLGQSRWNLAPFSTNYLTIPGNGCGTAVGRDRVFSMTVNAGSTLAVTLTPDTVDAGMLFTNALSPFAYVVTTSGSVCDSPSRSCEAAVNLPLGPMAVNLPKTIAWSNKSTEAKNILFVVGSSFSATPLTWDLTLDVAVSPIAQGETCESARGLAPTVGNPAVFADSTARASQDLRPSSTCGVLNSAGNYTDRFGDRIFTVTIPANRTVRVATTTTLTTASLNLSVVRGPLSACTAAQPMCSNQATASAAGMPVSVDIANMSASPEVAWVVVSGNDFVIPFEISATVQ
jgi:hypothetical protein